MSHPSVEHAAPGRLSVASYVLTALQLALVLHAIRVFDLEASFGLVAITPVVFFGFLAHAWAPARLKLPLFLALSIAAFCVVLGLGHGAILVALSLGLIGLCHLPAPFWSRVLLVALAGGVLAALRAGWIETTWALTVVPVVGAMFMFRAIVYLYDLRTEREPASVWMRLSYFFLLPNVCFLLFPVVDYRTFQRTYYEKEARHLHQRGLEWMLRGVVHLLLYRAVYAYVTPAVAEVQDLSGVVLFGVSSYLLYLRVSGHFHLIVGMLHLFGFHLPETNHNYLFASSFTDTWRRINIYWTEFMKKIVYYPAFMRLRRHGMLFAMAVATALTFLATWLLHAYQWFWLHGDFLLVSDGLFWGVAGVLALGTMLWEARRGSQGALTKTVPSWGAALRRSVQTLIVFCMICTIWSLWCSASFAEWRGVFSQARHAPTAQVLTLAGIVAALLLAGSIGQRMAAARPARIGAAPLRARAATATGALVVALLGHAPVQAAFGDSFVSALAPITGGAMNERDSEHLVAGYYDRLIDRFGGQTWEETRLEPEQEVFLESPVSEEVEGPLQWELPRSTEQTFQDVVVKTNRFGMRDKEYAEAKPASTFRIAILGTCYEMGTGVSNHEVWEAVAEEQLARELTPETGLTYENLNFSVAGYNLLQLVTVVREKLPAFEPDLVVVSNHVRSSVDFILKQAKDDSEWPRGLKEFIAVKREESGVNWEGELESWAFREIALVCEEMGAKPVLLSVPLLEELRGLMNEQIEARIEQQLERARELGYEVLDTRAAFEGQTFESVAIPHLQRSPNALGHRLLSEDFNRALLEKADALGLQPD